MDPKLPAGYLTEFQLLHIKCIGENFVAEQSRVQSEEQKGVQSGEQGGEQRGEQFGSRVMKRKNPVSAFELYTLLTGFLGFLFQNSPPCLMAFYFITNF